MKRASDRSSIEPGLVLDPAPLLDVQQAVGIAAFARWLERAETEIESECRAIIMALADGDRWRATAGCRHMVGAAGQAGAIGLRSAAATLECVIAVGPRSIRDLAPELRQLREEMRLALAALGDVRLLMAVSCGYSAQLVP